MQASIGQDALRGRPALVVVALSLLASVWILPNAMTLDDVPIIRDNALIHGLGRLGEALTSPYWPPPFRGDLYRPVTSFLLAIEFGVGAGAPIVCSGSSASSHM